MDTMCYCSVQCFWISCILDQSRIHFPILVDVTQRSRPVDDKWMVRSWAEMVQVMSPLTLRYNSTRVPLSSYTSSVQISKINPYTHTRGHNCWVSKYLGPNSMYVDGSSYMRSGCLIPNSWHSGVGLSQNLQHCWIWLLCHQHCDTGILQEIATNSFPISCLHITRTILQSFVLTLYLYQWKFIIIIMCQWKL